MFEHFTDRAMKAMSLAQAEARSHNHCFIDTEHMLLGLLVEPEALGARTLAALNISLDDVRMRVQEMLVAKGVVYTASPPLTPRMKKVFELSFRECLDLGHDHIGTEHILLGLLREGGASSRDTRKSRGRPRRSSARSVKAGWPLAISLETVVEREPPPARAVCTGGEFRMSA
jgi:ATP-dependent Clp protease ATP-binding subunit ClpA